MRTMAARGFRTDSLLRAAVLLLVAVFLAGCRSPLQYEKMVPAVTNHPRDAYMIFAEQILLVQKGAQLTSLEAAVKRALENADWAVRRVGGGTYTLHVSVISEPLQTTRPVGIWLELKGSISVRYVLKDNSSRTVFDDTIWSEGISPATEHYSGGERINYVIERYSSKNISEFMNRLDKFAIAESKRKSTEVASKPQTDMVEKLKQYDIFSSVPFYVTYRPVDYSNYQFADIYDSASSYLLLKLQAASLQQLRGFQRDYGGQLYNRHNELINNLIADKEREAEKNTPIKEAQKILAPEKVVPKRQMPSRSDSVSTKSQPAQKTEEPAKAELPKKTQPAPNPF